MTAELGFALAEIDPEDFKGTTVAVERVEDPNRSLVAKVVEPLLLAGRRKLSIIREVQTGDGYIIDWDILLNGGEDKGLHFTGMQEEVALRYHPKRNLRHSPMPSNAWIFP